MNADRDFKLGHYQDLNLLNLNRVSPFVAADFPAVTQRQGACQ